MKLANSQQSGLLAATLLLCVSGAWISDGLLQLHDGLPGSAATAGRFIARFCSSETPDGGGCQASARSAWSEIRLAIPGHPLEVPVALMAIGYFIALAVWYAFVGEATLRWRPLRWLPIALVTVGTYASLFFISLMALGRAPWCAGCVAVHAINFLLATAVFLSRWHAPPAQADQAALGYRQSAAVVLFAIALIGALFHSRARRMDLQGQVAELEPYRKMVESAQQNPKLMLDAYLIEPRRSIPIRPDEATPSAKHELVIFSDYECPGCQVTANFIQKEVVPDFGASLDVVVRHYPLCRACNPNVPRTIHPDACIAAYAAEAARTLGGRAAFDRMSNLLFANQSFLGGGIDRSFAVQAGVDPESFIKLLNDPAIHQRVDQDIAQGHALGVTNTPTLFLDGRKVPAISLAPPFWRAISDTPPKIPARGGSD